MALASRVLPDADSISSSTPRPRGLSNAVLPLPTSVFAPRCVAYEMVYGRETAFMAQARDAGARTADGLGMLVEQAAEAFFVWRGVRPHTAPVLARAG
jgi:shikimate dehydrogenase